MTMVIAGAGLAGAKAAETLRAQGYSGDVVLIGREPERPYERPPLSKGRLLGTAERDSVYVHDAQWYHDNGVELVLGVDVTAVDRQARHVELSDGRHVRYTKLLLATGASPRRLDLPGALYLRTLADSDALDAALSPGRHVVIAGAGWIGLETAAAARARGAEVTVVETGRLPLQRVLGDEVDAVFAELHREHGVTFRFGTPVTADLLAELAPDVLIAAVGVRPEDDVAAAAGLKVDDGVLTDESLRTSDPDIYAAGDVARIYHPLLRKHIRVEHWAAALNAGQAAARAMLGEQVSYQDLPFFYTDQYDLGMEYSGYAAPGDYDRVVLRGSVHDRQFLAFWTRDGRVLAGMNVNVWDVQDDIQSLVRAGYAGTPVDLTALADPEVSLPDLLPRNATQPAQ